MEYMIFKEALERVIKNYGGSVEADTNKAIYLYDKKGFNYGIFYFDDEGKLINIDFD